MNGPADIGQLLEIESIKQLKARQSRAIDTKDWVSYEALHAPEHVSDVDGKQAWTGSTAITNYLAKLHKNLGIISIHHAHSPQIKLLSETSATGIWAMESHLVWKKGAEEERIHAFGFYHETYEKRNGDWLFTSRRLERLWVTETPGAVLDAGD